LFFLFEVNILLHYDQMISVYCVVGTWLIHSSVIIVTGATEDAITAAREAFHMHLAKIQKAQQQQHTQDTSEEDLSQMDERELEAEFAGQFTWPAVAIV
jgi:hypothetical protein